MLVSDPLSMEATLRRLRIINDCFVFWNEERSLKLMLRNDPEDPEVLSFELLLAADEDDEDVERLMELLPAEGFTGEPGLYLIESWSWPETDFAVDQARAVMNAVNDAYAYRVCPCRKYIIKDEPPICTFCQMTRTAEDKALHFCAICREEGMRMHMVRQSCCGQLLHERCLSQWHGASGDARCALCRQTKAE